jgi:hypothetical protein
MEERKSILIRIPQDLVLELRAWAERDLRSLNGQIEFILREAVRNRRGQAKERPEKSGAEKG